MVKGTPRFDGIALKEGTFNFLGPSDQLTAKAAFVSNATGQTHGWTTANAGWSKETIEALHALRAAMESDLAKIHLTDAYDPHSTSEPSTSPDAPFGLGEHLGDDEVPQA